MRLFVYAPFRLAGSFSSGFGGEGFRNVPEEEANFSIMDVKLEDVEGPFSLVFTALLTLSRLIRCNQDAEKLGYDN